MARESGLSQTAVSRIWRAFGLQPHRQETFKLSSDPLFVEKVRDIVGLYLDPPLMAMVLCVDEKSHPLAPASRGASTSLRTPPADSPHSFLPIPLYSQSSSSDTHLVLERWSRRSAPVTHQDQGLRALRCSAPGCIGSPRKPSVPCRVQSRRITADSHSSMVRPITVLQPLMAHGTGATNSIDSGGIGERRSIRSIGFTNPLAGDRCRPIENLQLAEGL